MKKKRNIKRFLWLAAALFALAIVSHFFVVLDLLKSNNLTAVIISDLFFLFGLVAIMCIYFFTEAYIGRIINLIVATFFVLFAWPFVFVSGIGGIFVFTSAILTMIVVSIQLSLPTEIEHYSNPNLLDDIN